MTQLVYWHAPIWEIVLLAVSGLALLVLAAWLALRRPNVRDALTAFDPALDRLPLFHFDGTHGLAALNGAGGELLARTGPAAPDRDDTTLVDAAMAAYESARATRREGWPTADDTLFVLPISRTGGVVTGVVALVSSSTFEPPVADPEASWIDADPLVWHALGDTLKVHRERPLARVRRRVPDGTGENLAQWGEELLTHTEELLLRSLLEYNGDPQPAERLFAAVWMDEEVDPLGLRPDQSDRLRRLVFQLRQRIEPEPGKPRYVCTSRGVGYVLYADHPDTTR